MALGAFCDSMKTDAVTHDCVYHLHINMVAHKDDSQVVRRGSGAAPQGLQVSNLMALWLQFKEKYV